MPSTYTSLLRFIDQANGENEFTWGDLADTNFQLIEDSIAGMHTENISGSADHTLTTLNGASDEARNMILQLTGTVSGDLSVFIPSKSKMYVILSDYSGSYTVTISTGSGSSVDLAAGDRMIVACDGTNVIKVANVASTTDSTRIFQPGMLQPWAGTIASIPSGWLFCNGQAVSRSTYAALFAAIGTLHGSGNGTTTFNVPDLRDVLVIGANQDDSGTPKTNITGSLTASGGSYAGATVTGASGDHSHGGSTGSYTLLEADIPSHSHAAGTLTGTAAAHYHTVFSTDGAGRAALTADRAAAYNDTVSTVNEQYTIKQSSAGSDPGATLGKTSTASSSTVSITGSTATTGSGGGHSHTISASGTHTHTVTLAPYKVVTWMIKT